MSEICPVCGGLCRIACKRRSLRVDARPRGRARRGRSESRRPALDAANPLGANVHKPPRRSSSPPLSDETCSDPNRSRPANAPVHVPIPTPQRAPARVHELTGGALPGRLAGDGPPLDRRRAHRAATARPGGQRRFSRAQLDEFIASMQRDGPGRGSSGARRARRLSARGVVGPHAAALSWPGARTSRAAAGRTTSRAAGRSCPRR